MIVKLRTLGCHVHFDKHEIIEMISILALLETEALEVRKHVEEQGPHAVKARHTSLFYIESRCRTLKDSLIRKIS